MEKLPLMLSASGSTATPASQLLDGVDIVLDATDSLQARLDIDRATYAAGLPWVMGAAGRDVGSVGSV
jgi:molybdopterin/thiamine biosynthesis adenylyltransferase